MIDWSNWAIAPAAVDNKAPAVQVASPASNWKADFVSFLGKAKVEREPNAKISIALPQATPSATPKVTRL